MSMTQDRRPIIKLKTLELIAREIGDLDTGTNLINFLTDCGVNNKLIEYPQTKWRMVYSVLIALTTSPNPKDQETLFKIIEEASHPLMHNGDEELAKKYEDRFNKLLKYDSLVLKKGGLKKIDEPTEQDNEDDDDKDDCFSYDGGISTAYENTDLELFILKKILIEHKQRDDGGFFAKELSFNNNSLEEICRVINRLIEDKILYLSANTRPERVANEGIGGIEDKQGFINWDLVQKLDRNLQEMNAESGCVIFDTDVVDEVKLKGRIDIAIEEFMNDKTFNELGYLFDIPIESYGYKKQREIILNDLIHDKDDELLIRLTDFRDPKTNVLKTLLALEKESILRMKGLESNPMYNQKGDFTGEWSSKDNPSAKIQVSKMQPRKQEPIAITIVGDVGIRGFEEKVILQKPKNKKIQLRNFPQDTKWADITIQFLNGQEVIVKVKDLNLQTTYKEFGFQDERKQLPNKQWEFLKLLAETGGKISWKSPRATLKGKKQKQLLAEALKAYFQINEDPFYSYNKEKAYKIKINLIPEATSTVNSKEQEIYKKDEDDLGIEEYRKEQSPEIYDK